MIEGLKVWWLDVVATFTKCFLIENRWLSLLKGIGVTVEISLLAVALGMVIGFVIALCSLSKVKILNLIAKVYTDVIRGTPSVTQLMIIYFVIFASVRWEKWIIAAIAFGINSGAYVSEIIRAGIMSIDKGQMEAGRSLGMKYSTVMRYIIIPQAIKNVLPALGNELITLFKDTSLVTVIGLADITKVAIQVQAKTYQAFMPFIGIAVVYLVIVLIMTRLLARLERRLRQSDRR